MLYRSSLGRPHLCRACLCSRFFGGVDYRTIFVVYAGICLSCLAASILLWPDKPFQFDQQVREASPNTQRALATAPGQQQGYVRAHARGDFDANRSSCTAYGSIDHPLLPSCNSCCGLPVLRAPEPSSRC